MPACLPLSTTIFSASSRADCMADTVPGFDDQKGSLQCWLKQTPEYGDIVRTCVPSAPRKSSTMQAPDLRWMLVVLLSVTGGDVAPADSHRGSSTKPSIRR
jgi:hypothetical protein